MTKQRYFILSVGTIVDTVGIKIETDAKVDYRVEKKHLIEEQISPVYREIDLGEVNTKSNDIKEILNSVRANIIVYRHNECEVYKPGTSLLGATKIEVNYYDYPELTHTFIFKNSTKWTLI